MKYFRIYKADGAKAKEVAKDEARLTLEGHWKDEYLDDIFDNDRAFRLWTPYFYIYTMDEEGRVPEAGFFGTVG